LSTWTWAARRDRLAGETDDLAVFAHRLAGGDVAQRHLVPGRDGLARRQAVEERGSGGKRKPGDGDVVVGLEADDRGHVGTSLVSFA
jgi:hypothetical protein